jgi:hypothetical protein
MRPNRGNMRAQAVIFFVFEVLTLTEEVGVLEVSSLTDEVCIFEL